MTLRFENRRLAGLFYASLTIGAGLLCLLLAAGEVRAALYGVPNGATNPNGWFILTGTGSANADGDTVHQMFFKIEVTGTTLDVQVFDTGTSGARDLNRGNDSTTTYTLRGPAGGVLANVTVSNDNATTENTLARLTVGGFLAPGSSSPFTVSPGLYELQIAMGTGTEVNAFGLSVPGYEVYTSTDAPGAAEAGQVIAGALNSSGSPVANITQPITLYPYVDRGCEITTSNYDMDAPVGPGAGSSGSTTSRLGTVTALTMSGGTVFSNDTLNPIQQATQAQDYGIWQLDNNTGTQQNILDWRVADYTGVTIVGANLPVLPNAPIRQYLPADGSLPGAPVAPLEPRVEQSLTPLSPSGSSTPGGPNPPVAGSTSLFEVNVALTNPTASGMTSVTLTANVPGGEVLYDCSTAPITDCAQVSGGGNISSEPADGGSGDVDATWATVAAGATVNLTYFVAVTPAGAGAVNVTSTPASGNGTRLTYTPAFSSADGPSAILLRGAGGDADSTTDIDLTWSIEDREDTIFTHTGSGATVDLSVAGVYRVSYGLWVRTTSTSLRYAGMANVEVNGVDEGACYGQAYNRGSSDSLDGVIVGECLIEVNAGDNVNIEYRKTASTSPSPSFIGANSWFHIQKLSNPNVITLRDAGGDSYTTNLDINWLTEVRKDSAFTHGADSAEITVNNDGFYRVSYGVGLSESGTSRMSSGGKIQVDTGGGFSDQPFGWSNTYIRGNAGIQEGAIGASALLNLNSGDKIIINTFVTDQGSTSRATATNQLHFDMEYLGSTSSVNVIRTHDNAGGDSIASAQEQVWDTEDDKGSEFTFSAPSQSITVASSGLYHIASTIWGRDATTTRYEIETFVTVNDTDENACRGSGYARTSAGTQEIVAEFNCYVELTANDVVKIETRPLISPTQTSATLGNRLAVSIQSMDFGAAAPTENVGPLCEMTVQVSTSVPNAVALSKLEANAYDGDVWLAWDTASEWANLGFNVYRAEGGAGRFVQMNASLILGAGTSTLKARYLFIDPSVEAGKRYAYLLEDVERTGKRTLHGPVSVTVGHDAGGALDPGDYDRVTTLGGEIPIAAQATLSSGSGGSNPIGDPPLTALAAAPAPDPVLPTAPDKMLRIISRDDTGMVIEIKSRAPDLSSVVLDGVPYTEVSIPGFSHMAEPGKPALPTLGLPIEIPDVADVDLAILRLNTKRVGRGILPAPAPALTLGSEGSIDRSYVPDAAVYSGTNSYPAAPVTLGGSVRQGEKRLLVLVLNPILWSPADGNLRHAGRVRVRINYYGAEASAAVSDIDARLQNQFLLASRGALKIAVSETGIQAVTGQALLDAGLNPATDPRALGLYREGREVAVLFEGEENGMVDPDDLLLFYGENRDDDHALARTYWLSGGNLSGLRMASRDAAPTGMPAGETLTPATVRSEKNTVYVPFVLNGETSNFVGDLIFLTPRDQFLDLTGVSGEAGTLRVRLQGATTDSNVDPDHHLRLSVNGVEVGDARWDGFEAFEGSFGIPAGTLAEGVNEIRFTPVNDTGAIFDFDYVDWVAVDHMRTLDAAGPSLRLVTTLPGDHTVGGIPGEEAILLDVTDPYAPVLLEGTAFTPGEGGGSLTFNVGSVGGGERHLALASVPGLVAPHSIVADTPSRLNAAPGADWLAIAHADFVSGTGPLADLRQTEGLRTLTVDVQDVYDEFGFGDPVPSAIRDYLAWQYERGGEPRLRYVLLVGDANYDERNYLGLPNRNFVSTKLLDGTFTERSSDNWFASFLGDDALPDVALGRLPVASVDQLADLVAKITAYAGQPLGLPWQQRSLLVADDGAKAFHAGEAAIFEAASDAMAAQLPPGFDPLKLYLSDIPEAEQQAVARQLILESLNTGALTVSYAGHGAITLWADEVIYRSSDLPFLRNTDRLPFVIVLNCLNGLFSAPLGDALGESMLLMPGGGAVAFFAPTGISPIGGQEILGEAIMRALFREGHLRIGDALLRGRAAAVGLPFFKDISESWVLLGDPATTLAFDPMPIADAGADRETKAKSKVRLSGSVSGGATGPFIYEWRLVSAPEGSQPELMKADRAEAVLRVDLPGDYIVALVVSAGGKTSAPDTARVRALPRGSNNKLPVDTF